MKYIFSLILITLILPIFVFAANPADLAAPIGGIDPNRPQDFGVHSQNQSSDFDNDALIKIIIGLINWFTWGIALVAVVFGLYAGYLFITAADDEKQLTKARSIIIWSIVGIAVAVLSFSIVSISKSIFLAQ